MSDSPIHVWHYIVPPTDPSAEPEWAAWVTADNANWGTLRVLHVPTQTIPVEEPVSLALDLGSLFSGRSGEGEWIEAVNTYVTRQREGVQS